MMRNIKVTSAQVTKSPVKKETRVVGNRKKHFLVSGVWCLMTLLLYLVICDFAFANGLAITNIAISSQDTTNDTEVLQFDITWNNSWNDAINSDAAWVFIKYSTDAGVTWNHATLKTSGTNPSGFSTGSGTGIDIIVSADKRGAFIQRSADGSGTLSATGVQFTWDYAADGVSDANAYSNNTRIKIFGIEMVYIPEGGFYAGDTVAGTNGEFQFAGTNSSLPAPVNSEESISFGTNVLQWRYTTDTGANDVASGIQFQVDESFPKGFAAYYIMKYEITQGQYAEFLNTLLRTQQVNRVATTITTDAITNVYVMSNQSSLTNRNTITCPASGNGTTAPIVFSVTRSDRACNYLSWMDLAAYADWSGLRPMTELEYEKAARGPLYPVSGEYAWGTASATAAATISGTENGSETISTSSANAHYNSTALSGGDTGTGPLRSGIYATSSTASRLLTGASYWGVMELTGNTWERAVTVGNTAGRSFSGTHGDGTLTTTASAGSTFEGNATNLDWPGLSSTINQGITGATGSGLKGGGWAVSSANLAARASVSSRYQAGTTDTTRGTDYGGRCVRTANA